MYGVPLLDLLREEVVPRTEERQPDAEEQRSGHPSAVRQACSGWSGDAHLLQLYANLAF